MRVIVGLGNPGERYKNTRHNIGFEAIDLLANKLGVELREKECFCLLGEGKIGEEEVILAKPQTYMNRSGIAVRLLVERYKINIEGLIVVYDDTDLPFGKIRIRKKGGCGGHKGLLSIIDHLGNPNFIRVRVGIGSPLDRASLTEYVLSRFEDDELPILKEAIEKAALAVEEIVARGVENAMSDFN